MTQTQRKPHSKSGKAASVFVLVLGTLLVGLGTAAVFVRSQSTGTAALLTVGAILVVVGLLGDRIEDIQAGGVAVRMRAQAAKNLVEADQASRSGDEERAEGLRSEADALIEASKGLAREYEAVRRGTASSDDRTVAMAKIVNKGQLLARTGNYSQGETTALFETGTSGNRIMALAAIEEKGDLGSPKVALEALSKSLSGFEMFHALRATESVIHAQSLSPELLAQIGTAIHEADAEGRLGKPGSDRHAVADRVLVDIRSALSN